MSKSALSFDHVHLVSTNPHATAEWYADKFEGTLVKSATIRGAPQVYVEFEDFILIVRGQRDGEDAKKNSDLNWGIEHFGLRVTGDFDAYCEALRQKNVTFSMEPRDFNPDTRIAFVDGPDGVSVELVSRRKWP